MDPTTICKLAALDPTDWGGLDVTHDDLPRCLGQIREEGTRRFPGGILAADGYRPESGLADVDVYWWMNGGRVELVDVRPLELRDSAALLASLGPPDLTVEYAEQERIGWRLARPPHGSIEEAVFGSRGLAVVLVPDDAGRRVVTRLRGFRPTSGREYVSNVVRSPIEFFE